MHQCSKGEGLIAASDYFDTVTSQSYFILTICLIPFHSPNGLSDRLSGLFLKVANQTVIKATLPQPSSKPALPIGHPVSRQHSHFPAQWSSTPWPLPRPPPQQPRLQQQLQLREQTRATSTYLWAILHSAAPIRDPALAHLTWYPPCT